MYQHAGEKGRRHPDPADPPRRRALQLNAHGTFENDRPPIFGAIGRDTGRVVVRQAWRSTRRALEPLVVQATRADATVMSDEWHGYDGVAATGRTHVTVNHKRREWARDDDGDGVREAHTNTIEGFWLGLRNWLRPFRGVSKWWLDSYVHWYATVHNAGDDVAALLRGLLGRSSPKGP